MSNQNSGSGNSTPVSRFTSQTASAEDLLKSHTVGLVHLSEFRKRRAEVLEAKEKEAHEQSLGITKGDTPGTEGESDSKTEKQPAKKKKKKAAPKAKLYFNDDDEENEEEVIVPKKAKDAQSTAKAAAEDQDQSNDSSAPVRRIRANPNVAVPPPKILTKPALTAEARARDALRKEFLALQERVRNTEIMIPFIFYDGANIPGDSVKVKKGDPVWLFLDRCRKIGANLGIRGGTQRKGKGRREFRKEWARISVTDLMLVKGNVIVPHHYEFYYFIANRIPDFSGEPGKLLFEYTDTLLSGQEGDKQQTQSSDSKEEPKLEGADNDPTTTKVVDRRWYERNKHIYPASLWKEYEPGKEFEETMLGVRKDNQGNVFFFS